MASGYKKSFALDLRLKERRHPLDRAQKCRVLVKNGVVLDSPEVIENPQEVSIANRLRRDAVLSERLVAPAMAAMGFEHSVPMFGYYLDFYHPGLKLCVEIDGSVHRNRKWYDRNRDARLRGHGIETYRFWSRTVHNELERVIHHVRNLVALKSPL